MLRNNLKVEFFGFQTWKYFVMRDSHLVTLQPRLKAN